MSNFSAAANGRATSRKRQFRSRDNRSMTVYGLSGSFESLNVVFRWKG